MDNLLVQNQNIVDRQLGLDKEPRKQGDEAPKPIGRRIPWPAKAAEYEKKDRDLVNEHWTKKIEEVEQKDGILGKS